MQRASTFVIAEVGVNHNGSVELAGELIDAAAEAGADAVKFQSFRSEALVSKHARKAVYQERTTGADESQFAMIKRLELDADAQRSVARRCSERGLRFMSTPFDLESLRLLLELGVTPLKIGSGDITFLQLLRAVGESGTPAILSTGMSTLGDVEAALGVLAAGYVCDRLGSSSGAEALRSPEGQAALRENVTLLHCTTEYPAPFDSVNLRAMATLEAAFGLPVGYSDHTVGTTVAVAAVALGARVIEKHFTLDRTLPGPDHAASIEPHELAQMVTAIRSVESALGSARKGPAPSELPNIAVARRSLVAARAIWKGEHFTTANLTSKRPGTGISAMRFEEWLGKVADRDYEEDALIE